MSHLKVIEITASKQVLGSACSSEDYNRSSVKRLFSSVFSIIDNDEYEISSFDFESTPRIERLLQDECFVMQVKEKVRNEGLLEGYHLPALKMNCNFLEHPYQSYALSSVNNGKICLLDHQDLCKVFSQFGELNKIILSSDKQQAYILFNSYINAYIAFKLLKDIFLRDHLQIVFQWVRNQNYCHQLRPHLGNYLNQIHWTQFFHDSTHQPYSNTNNHQNYNYFPQNTKLNKLTCRYDIQIQNQKEFQVARRIIGSKGCNMKKIIEDSINSVKITGGDDRKIFTENINELLKLRLRGKGSGYKEGSEQVQSNENLHLCISAKDQLAYNSACLKVESLLEGVYEEYLEFSRKQGKGIQFQIKKLNGGQGNSNSFGEENQEPNLGSQQLIYEKNINIGNQIDVGKVSEPLEPISADFRLSSQKINELLELRNKARRQLNFHEADRIRNYLRNCGVSLIDEKGRRGKATDVTTWKYLYC